MTGSADSSGDGDAHGGLPFSPHPDRRSIEAAIVGGRGGLSARAPFPADGRGTKNQQFWLRVAASPTTAGHVGVTE